MDKKEIINENLEIPGKLWIVTGYECKICGAIGHFDEFPKSVTYHEWGKEVETFCKNSDCDGWQDDLIEKSRPA